MSGKVTLQLAPRPYLENLIVLEIKINKQTRRTDRKQTNKHRGPIEKQTNNHAGPIEKQTNNHAGPTEKRALLLTTKTVTGRLQLNTYVRHIVRAGIEARFPVFPLYVVPLSSADVST
jgi:hypothetical protein